MTLTIQGALVNIVLCRATTFFQEVKLLFKKITEEAEFNRRTSQSRNYGLVQKYFLGPIQFERDGGPPRGPQSAMNFIKWAPTKTACGELYELPVGFPQGQTELLTLVPEKWVDILSHAHPDQDFSLSLESSWSGCG